MSLYDRRKIAAALVASLVLGGCGFKPIYSEGSAASELHGKIKIESGKGREFFEMRERLIARFGFSDNPTYTLVFTYNVESDGLAVSGTAEITRYNLKGRSAFKVMDSATDKVLFGATVKSTTAYSATSETYPTQVAEQDALSRLALAMADQIVTRVSSTASQWAK